MVQAVQAQVYKGVRGGVQDVAVKMLHYGDSEDGLKQFVDECCILKSLNYDRNVVQFYGACLLSGRTPMLVRQAAPELAAPTEVVAPRLDLKPGTRQPCYSGNICQYLHLSTDSCPEVGATCASV